MNGHATIGLGTVQWGMPYGIANITGQPAGAEVGSMLRMAKQHGVRLLDTAAGYGVAEKQLGEWNAASQGFRIVTKTVSVGSAAISDADVALALAAFKQSLARLKCDHVYGLMAHNAENLLMADGARLWEALQECKRQGLAIKIGVSVYTPDQLSSILDRFQIDIVQLPFNVYDQRFLRTGLLDRLKVSGVEIHARSAFLQGLLLIPPDILPGQFETIREHHGRFYEALDHAGLSPLGGSLGFCLAQPQIDHVIVGCESVSQLEEILGVASRGGLAVRHPESFSLDDEAIINPSRWSR